MHTTIRNEPGATAKRDDFGRGLAEEALRASEERYRMLLDAVQDYAIFMLDPEGRVVSWNAGAERIKGYTAEEIIGHNFACFFTPEDVSRGRPGEVLRLTAANGRHEEHGIRVRKDGSRFLAHVKFAALRDASGGLQGFSEFSHDISESEASEARYRGLLEAAPDAMVVVDKDGTIVLLNMRAEKQFGFSRDELVGQQVKRIIPDGFAERIIADGTRSAADALEQQIGMGIELSGRGKDGGEFPIEIMLSPLKSAKGILVTAAIRDISVRKAAELRLAQMESRYRGLLEAAPDAMVVVDQAGRIVLLNVQAEKQFGYRRDELVGQQVKNIIPEGFAERIIADGTRSAAEALAQQIGTGIELLGRRKDGSKFPIEIMLSPLESAEGILVTAAIRDISVRKRADEALSGQAKELASANKELEAFSYSVSHDLRSPLRSIDGFSQILLEDYGDKLDAGGRDSLQRVRAASQRMGVLIDDMLALSKVTRREIRAERTDLSALATAIETELRESDPQRLVDFVIAPGLLAYTDARLIRIALWNLLGNAWKFTGRRDKARIKFGITDGKTYFVKDDGAGFDMAYADKLFGAFQRMHGITEFEGTGIGLATVHRIIHRLGGRVWAEAVPDLGATFYFTLSERSTP